MWTQIASLPLGTAVCLAVKSHVHTCISTVSTKVPAVDTLVERAVVCAEETTCDDLECGLRKLAVSEVHNEAT